jgi:hypothetical protein
MCLPLLKSFILMTIFKTFIAISRVIHTPIDQY